MLVGSNWLRDATVRWNATGTFADPDVTSSTYPSYRVADGFDWLATAPNTTANTWYLLFNLGAEIAFDVVAILGHSSLSGATVTVEVADDSAFSSNLDEIYSFGAIGSGTERLIALELLHTGTDARSYTARYVRLKFAKGSAFTPYVREVIIGARRQLKENPSRPFDYDSRRSTTERFTANNGQMTDYVLSRGQHVLDALLEPYEEPYLSDMISFFNDDIDCGVEPFLWIPRPETAPAEAYLMKLDEPSFSFPADDMVTQRSWRLQATEQGAQYVSRET
jgi:hypothetical protein